MERLIESLRSAPVVDMGEYNYFVHPVTDCIPLVEPALLREIADAFRANIDLDDVEKIFTAESMGIHHATALSLAADIPFVVARKRSYGFEGEVAVHQVTGYDDGELYVNGIEPNDRLLLLDDVFSTGGTMEAMYDAVREIGAEPVAAAVVIRRRSAEARSLPIDVVSLVEVEVVDGTVHVTPTV